LRCLALVSFLLAALAIAAPASAQSPALKEAWQKTSDLGDAGNYAEAEIWGKKALALAQKESGADGKSYATSLTNLGDLYRAQGRNDDAEPLYKRALAIDEKAFGPSRPEVARVLNKLAMSYRDAGQYDDAEPLHKRALAIREKALRPDDPEIAQSLNNLASLYNDQGRYDEAEPLLKRAVAIAEKALGPDHLDVAVALNNLGGLYVAEGHYGAAEPPYQRALAIREKALGPNDSDVAQSLINLAFLYDNEGRYGEAEPLYQRALAIDQKALGPDHRDVGAALVDLGALYYHEGRYGDVESLFKRALAVLEKALGPDHPAVADCLNNLASLYQDEGRYDEAEELARRALAIREKSLGPDHPDLAINLNNLATLYMDEGRNFDALPLYQRALAIDEKSLGPDHPGVATDLNNLAGLYEGAGLDAKAEPLLRRALAIDEKALGPDHTDVANSLGDLAAVLDDEGHHGDTEPLYQRALAIDEKALGPDHPDVAADLSHLAAAYQNEGRLGDAEPLYRRAETILEKVFGPNHPDVAAALSNLAELDAAQSRYADALPLIERAVAIEASRAASGKDEGKGQHAEQRHQRSLFVDDVSITAHLLAAGTGDAARLREEGFAALQWSKASDTAAAVAHMAARFAIGSDTLAALVRARQDARDRLDAIDKALLAAASKPPAQRDTATEDRLRSQVETLRRDLKSRDAELAAKFPSYAELANPKPVGIAEIENLLAPDEALLAFALGGDESYIAVIGHDSYDIKIVPVGAKALRDAIKKLRASLDPANITDDLPPFEAGTAYQLYRQLLAPAEASLKDIKQLYVVTDGALESLPLGVLLTQKSATETLSEPEDLRGAPWLAKHYAVSVLPSISALKALRQFAQASRATKPYFGIGDPLLKDHPPAGKTGRGVAKPVMARGIDIANAYRGDRPDTAKLLELPSLPETANELEAEAKLFNAGAGAILLREAATVTAVKKADLADRRIIAFATHGLMAGDIGVAEPGLVMTPPLKPTQADDGLLKASEVAQLKLNADLVILSACNTAASDGTPGAEGFSGLAKAFLYAGARTLLVSNWPVASDATVELMTRLSGYLEHDHVGRAEALRLAMLDLMKDDDHPSYAHPLFWAPFVVVGEGR
jgi:CHAT domain-containing protein/Tfp pilus assembly protein PilF